VLGVLGLNARVGKGQTPYITTLEVSHDLHSNQINALVEDSLGQLYFATERELIRYDGSRYVTLYSSESSSSAITALACFQDKIWAGAADGKLYIYDQSELVRYDSTRFQSKARISDLITAHGRLFVGTYGEGVFEIGEEEISHLSSDAGLQDNFVYDLEVHSGSVWIATDGGISELDMEDGSTYLFSMKNGLPDNIVQCLESVSDTLLAIGMYDGGVAYMNTKTYQFDVLYDEETPWEISAVVSLEMDEFGQLWIGTKSDGILVCDVRSKHTYSRQINEDIGLVSNRIRTIVSSRSHDIWIGTQNGISQIGKSPFEHLKGTPDGIGNSIYDILVEKDGTRWLATDQGLKILRYGMLGEMTTEEFMPAHDDINQQVVSMCKDNRGLIWLGTYGNGIYVYHPDEKRFEHISRNQGFNNPNIIDIVEDKLGRIWVATLGAGLQKITYNSNHVGISREQSDKFLRSDYIYTCFVDSKGQLWVGTDGGGATVFSALSNDFVSNFSDQLGGKTVYGITEDGSGNIWIMTANNGFYVFDGKEMQPASEHYSMLHEEVVAICADYRGNVVATHANGVDILFDGTKEFVEYSIPSEDRKWMPNLNAIFCDVNDLVWIGTESGLLTLRMDQLIQTNITPTSQLSEIKVNYKPIHEGHASVFDYDQNHFTFDYNAIWTKNPDAVTYRYILEGFDKEWSVETATKTVTYSSLPEGEYLFKVQASAANGSFAGAQIASYKFEIRKPFWLNPLFYLGILVVGALILVVFLRYRTKQLLHERERLESIVSQRTAELVKQKNIVEAKNEEILSSISYAKRIQRAILPRDRTVKRHLPQSFVLYKPKDIVAGDFYWLEYVTPTGLSVQDYKPGGMIDFDKPSDKGTRDGVILVAAADCTGHGVPGAMVSVVCHEALNRAVREYSLVEPAAILDKVLQLVVGQFQKSEENVRDGMDIGLCALEYKGEKGMGVRAEFSGAQNPMYIVTRRDMSEELGRDPALLDGDLHLYEIKGDKQPIGKYASIKPFSNHAFTLYRDDCIYLSSDGFADQFGGPKGKKLKYMPFKKLLLAINDLPMEEQKEQLDTFFNHWKGDYEQIDDVCVIGLRISID